MHVHTPVVDFVFIQIPKISWTKYQISNTKIPRGLAVDTPVVDGAELGVGEETVRSRTDEPDKKITQAAENRGI